MNHWSLLATTGYSWSSAEHNWGGSYTARGNAMIGSRVKKQKQGGEKKRDSAKYLDFDGLQEFMSWSTRRYDFSSEY
ncbi:MAG: hypothetical protein ACFFD4_26800 [Candidatus Odinarchaeota archaeon]